MKHSILMVLLLCATLLAGQSRYGGRVGGVSALPPPTGTVEAATITSYPSVNTDLTTSYCSTHGCVGPSSELYLQLAYPGYGEIRLSGGLDSTSISGYTVSGLSHYWDLKNDPNKTQKPIWGQDAGFMGLDYDYATQNGIPGVGDVKAGYGKIRVIENNNVRTVWRYYVCAHTSSTTNDQTYCSQFSYYFQWTIYRGSGGLKAYQKVGWNNNTGSVFTYSSNRFEWNSSNTWVCLNGEFSARSDGTCGGSWPGQYTVSSHNPWGWINADSTCYPTANPLMMLSSTTINSGCDQWETLTSVVPTPGSTESPGFVAPTFNVNYEMLFILSMTNGQAADNCGGYEYRNGLLLGARMKFACPGTASAGVSVPASPTTDSLVRYNMGWIGDNGIHNSAGALARATEYQTPPTLTMTTGTSGTFDYEHGNYTLTAVGNAVSFRPQGNLYHPAFVITSWTDPVPANITINGVSKALNTDYVAVDLGGNNLLIQILASTANNDLITIGSTIGAATITPYPSLNTELTTAYCSSNGCVGPDTELYSQLAFPGYGELRIAGGIDTPGISGYAVSGLNQYWDLKNDPNKTQRPIWGQDGGFMGFDYANPPQNGLLAAEDVKAGYGKISVLEHNNVRTVWKYHVCHHSSSTVNSQDYCSLFSYDFQFAVYRGSGGLKVYQKMGWNNNTGAPFIYATNYDITPKSQASFQYNSEASWACISGNATPRSDGTCGYTGYPPDYNLNSDNPFGWINGVSNSLDCAPQANKLMMLSASTSNINCDQWHDVNGTYPTPGITSSPGHVGPYTTVKYEQLWIPSLANGQDADGCGYFPYRNGTLVGSRMKLECAESSSVAKTIPASPTTDSLVRYNMAWIGDNGIHTDDNATARATEYQSPPTLTMAVGTSSGFDYANGNFALTASANAVTFSASSTLYHPAFQIGGWTAAVPSTITVNGSTKLLNVDYVAVVNGTSLLLQILSSVPADQNISIGGGTYDGVALLPTLSDFSARPDTTGYTTVNISNATELNSAIAGIACGQRWLFTAGVTITGQFIIPKVDCVSQPIVWESTASSSITAPPYRVKPSDDINMYRLVTNANAVPVLTFTQGTNGFYIRHMTFGQQKGYWAYNSIEFQTGNTEASLPHDIVFDQIYGFTWPGTNLRRTIYLGGYRLAVVNSDLRAHEVGSDSQCASLGTSTGQIWFVNNYCEGSTENFIIGGGGATWTPAHSVNNIFRYNLFRKPLTWFRVGDTWDGVNWAVKNIFELKDGSQTLIEKNVFDSSWAMGQVGTAILFTPRAANGYNDGNHGNAYNCTVTAISGTTITCDNINRFEPGTHQVVAWTSASGLRGSAVDVSSCTPSCPIASYTPTAGTFVVSSVPTGLQVGDQIFNYPVPLDFPNAQTNDVTLRYNVVKHATAGLSISGEDAGDTGPNGTYTERSSRLSIHDNFFLDMSKQWTVYGDGSGYLAVVQDWNGSEDHQIFHNFFSTDYTGLPAVQPTGPSSYGSSSFGVAKNYVVRDNIVLATTYGWAVNSNSLKAVLGDPADGTHNPTAQYVGSVYTKNLLYPIPTSAGNNATEVPSNNQVCGLSSATCFPSTTAFLKDVTKCRLSPQTYPPTYVDLDYTQCTLANSSPYANQGSDGQDIGVTSGGVSAIAQIALNNVEVRGVEPTIAGTYSVPSSGGTLTISGGSNYRASDLAIWITNRDNNSLVTVECTSPNFINSTSVSCTVPALSPGTYGVCIHSYGENVCSSTKSLTVN